MIVVCSTCQARFKVADEKIGPRGARVRCSKCQTVFLVHHEPGMAPAEAPPPPPAPAGGLDLDLEAGPRSGVRPNGFMADPFGRPAAPPQPPQQPAPDPFGGADPFQAAAPPVPAQADPFGSADPFAPAGGARLGAVDPFEATVASPEPGLPASAVTDLSDLLGTSAGAPPAPPEPEPDLGAVAAPPAPEPSGVLDDGFDFDASAGPTPDLEAAPVHAPATLAEPAPEPDLALAERTPATGLAAAPMPGFGDFAGVDPFGDEGGSAEGGGLETAPPEPPAPAPAPAVPAMPAARAAAEPPPVAAPSEAEVAEATFRHRPSRARSIAINAISLVALLAVALAILAFWRGGRPGAGGLFRPSAVLGGGEPTALFAAERIRSGFYDRSDAPPILFVSGTATSRADRTVPGLRVRVEVLQKSSVLARGEVRAGAIATPEELYPTRDAAAVAAAQERHAAAAPAAVKPGDSLPFLVAISDYPADAAGAGLRVTVEPIDGAAPDGGARQP